MKIRHLILALCGLLSTFISVAQNGGQYFENSSVKLEYLGGTSVKVTNKQSCTASIEVKDNLHDSTLVIPGNSSGIFTIAPALVSNIKVKARTLTNCGSPDYGWVELTLLCLPLNFSNVSTQYLSKSDQVLVTFTVSDAINVNRVEIQVSFDGKNYVPYGIVPINFMNPNQTYKYYLTAVNLRAAAAQNK